jgi:hypothetical protein
MDASFVAQDQKAIRKLANSDAMPSQPIETPTELAAVSQARVAPEADVLGHIARLEASTGAALALLRRCIVEEEAPTREALAAEAEFAFGMPSDAALAEMDQVAELVGISSLR